MANISIDPELRDLCFALTSEERALLRESLLAEGCRHPIICWDTSGSPILDGHTRHDICINEGIPYQVQYLDLPDRAAARQWILRNQLGRRNLTDAQRALLRGRLYNELKADHGGDRKSSAHNAHLIPQSQTAQQDTATAIAEQDGVNPATVRRDAEFATAAEAVIQQAPDLKQAIERGTIPAKAVKALASAPKATLDELAKLEGADLRKAARAAAKPACPNCGSAERDEDGDCAKCHEPASSFETTPRSRRREATAADHAKAQVKIWADTIARWLSKSPSIDEYRAQWPGQHADAVLNAAKALYESLKAWQKVVK